MPGLTSSQEMQLEYFTWREPESPPIAIRRRAMEGIHQEVTEAFAAAPHRGAETGGILLGRREEHRIVVEDFEPVPSEHRFGPSYQLSDADRELLQETLDWSRGGAQPGLSVLGFYRSQTLPVVELCAEDEDLMRAHFAAAEDLVLLVKPSFKGISETDFWVRHCGRMAPAPRMDALLAPETEPEHASGRRWRWYTAALLLGLAGGALGYWWWHSAMRVEPMVAAPIAAHPAARPIMQGPSAPSEPDTAGIHELLDGWVAALKRGDAEAAAQCYAPVVSAYFERHDVTRLAVLQSIRRGRARYGRLDAYGISGLVITPVSDSRAEATFRKHWRFAGRGRPGGEEEERMTLVRTGGIWQISSEQTAR